MAVGPWQIALIILVILLLFGASRLSSIGKGLGEGIRNFKKGISGDDEHEPPKQMGSGDRVDVSTKADSKESV